MVLKDHIATRKTREFLKSHLRPVQAPMLPEAAQATLFFSLEGMKPSKPLKPCKPYKPYKPSKPSKPSKPCKPCKTLTYPNPVSPRKPSKPSSCSEFCRGIGIRASPESAASAHNDSHAQVRDLGRELHICASLRAPYPLMKDDSLNSSQ